MLEQDFLRTELWLIIHDTFLQALKKAEVDLKKYERDNASDTTNLKKYEAEVEKAARSLAGLAYQEGSWEECSERMRESGHALKGLRQEAMNMSSRLHWLEFKYQDPERNFDRSKVYGVAARHVRVKDQRFCAALDAAGGGKVSTFVFKRGHH